jgi:hypothetical protein
LDFTKEGKMLFVPQLLTSHRDGLSSGLSPRLWAKVTGSVLAPDGGDRLVFVGDDFLTFKGAGTYLTPFSELGYTAYIDVGGTLTQLADETGGVLALTTDGTDEDEIWIQSGDATGPLGFISDTAGADFLTVFEARYKISSISNAVMSSFVGLASPGCAAQNTKVDATGVLLTTGAFIGFDVLLDGDSIQFTYQAASQTVNQKIAGVHVPVADDFVKLGFVYDPQAEASKRIKVFVNNTEQSTYVTATNIAAATFPDAEALSFLAGFKNTTAATGELAIDWWAFAQLIKPATN